MKRFSDKREPTPLIPPVVEVVQIQIAVPAVAVKHQHVQVAVRVLPLCMRYHPFHHPSNTLWVVSYVRARLVQYRIPSIFFFEVSAYTTLSQVITGDILDVWILGSAAGSRDRPHIRLLPNTV